VLLWTGFILVVLACLALDLGAFRRRHAHGESMSIAEAARWTIIWIAVGVLFSGAIYLVYENGWFGFTLHTIDGVAGNDGSHAAALYLTAYLLEKSLSIDNLFVMALIFKSFGIAPVHQHRVLLWGIIGAIVMRGIMIGGGLFLIERFTWIFYVFGAYLAYSGVKLLRTDEEETPISPMESRVGLLLRRLVPITQTTEGDRFVVVRDGKRQFTQLLLCLLMIELTDVVFAVDSVPAVLAISVEPFICYTSNIFAILGLRSLYFVLAEMMARFQYLKHSLSAILIFIGAKLVLHEVIAEHVSQRVSIWGSLSFIFVTMGIGIAWSWKKSAKDGTPSPKPITPEALEKENER
jgi:tellurite resistance protein TerC